jgi:hypothetical protein
VFLDSEPLQVVDLVGAACAQGRDVVYLVTCAWPTPGTIHWAWIGPLEFSHHR